MSETQNTEAGLLASVRRMLHTLHGLLENRIELFLVEVQEERVRVVEALLLAVCGVFCTVMTLLLLTFTLVVIFWENHLGLVLVLVIAVYAGCAIVALYTLRQRLQNWQLFSATLEQIRKDRACLEQKQN